MILYQVQGSQIIGGPYAVTSAEVRRITSTGNPEALPLSHLAGLGLLPEVRDTLGPGQGYGAPELLPDLSGVRLPAVALPPPGPPPVPQSIPTRLAKLVLLASGKLGPSVTTLAQLDTAILGFIDQLIPAGLQREGAKAAWLYSTVFELTNATLVAMMSALGMTEAERDALFVQADAMRQQEIAAQGGGD